MGNICDCMKLQPETSSETIRLLPKESGNKLTNGDTDRGSNHYQTVIEEAQRLVRIRFKIIEYIIILQIGINQYAKNLRGCTLFTENL